MPRKLKRKKEAKKKKNIEFVTDALEFFNFFFVLEAKEKLLLQISVFWRAF